MRHLKLKTIKYRLLEEIFREWLYTLGYAATTVYSAPNQVHEFLYWLEQHHITDVKQVTAKYGKDFIRYFQDRKNHRRAGGVSTAHVNGVIGNLNKFFRYLDSTGQGQPGIKLSRLKEDISPDRAVFTRYEIKLLYNACDDTPIGQRDRAMLSVYYGCGLRRSEGVSLDVPDVLFERRLLYVRKTKNNYERYVPMSRGVICDLERYLYDARPILLIEGSNDTALFISERGGRISAFSMDKRLEQLKKKTVVLHHRPAGLHALRHSIATHLLQRGMEQENIALFLGHRSLDSTQVYTHIVNQSPGEG